MLRILGKRQSINVRQVLWICDQEVMDRQANAFNGASRFAFQAIVRKNPDAGTWEQIAQSFRCWASMLRLLECRLEASGTSVCGETD